MNCKTKFNNHNKQVIDLKGGEPKSNGDLMVEEMAHRKDCEDKEDNNSNTMCPLEPFLNLALDSTCLPPIPVG
jgi:hypothetical protein